MADPPSVLLRPRTDEDVSMLFRIAADLDTWEERNPSPPAPLTRAAYEAAGVAEEGRLREHAWVRGRYEDLVLMGILRAERG